MLQLKSIREHLDKLLNSFQESCFSRILIIIDTYSNMAYN